MSNFKTENRLQWHSALLKAFPNGIPESASWTDALSICDILKHFCLQNLNHTMLPFGGGNDICNVLNSKERGCIELQPSRRTAYICKPSRLYFEGIKEDLPESFFLLETDWIEPSGVYEELTRESEELLELPDGQYVDRSHLDAGHLGYDEDDREIPIPEPNRIVVRYFSGKFLFVAKGSLWNSDPATYDGRHNSMSHASIRQAIEHSLQNIK